MSDYLDGSFLARAAGEAKGKEAVILVLKELEKVFDEFAVEVEELYSDDPENDDLSQGYIYSAGWCYSWRKDLENE
jgi:hypothetical protein